MVSFVTLLLLALLAPPALGQETSVSERQPSFACATYFEIIGSICHMSQHLELGIDEPFSSGPVRSIRVSSGLGICWADGLFAPTRLKVFLGGEHCCEIGAGLFIRVGPYVGLDDDGWYSWSSAVLNPTWLIAYRYEPADGGVLFRFAIDSVVDAGTGKFIATPGLSIGYSF